jgi:hypothetical protein
MSLKGKIRLEIKDAKTGKVKYSREEHNIVTDAVYNVLNGATARQQKAGGAGTGLIFGSVSMEAIKALFGGILIFDTSIDTSHIIPSYIEMRHMIGNGNMFGDIANNTHKGSLRIATITEDTAEFTWDFSTGECNGEITSICLTSCRGGELGCNIESRDNARYSDSFINVLGNELTDGGTYPLVAATPRNMVFHLDGSYNDTNGLVLITDEEIVLYRENINSAVLRWNLRDYSNSYLFNYDGTLKNVVPEEDEASIGIGLDGYKLIGGPITDYALQGKVDFETQGGNPIYTLHLVKCESYGQEEIDVPMNNIVTAILNDYQNRGLVEALTPSTPEQIVQNLNLALQTTCFTYGNKLIWLVGYMNYTEEANDFITLYIQEYNGSFITVEPTSADSIFYNLIGRNIANKVRLWGTLYNYSFVTNTCFSIAYIIDKLYLTSNDYYFLINLIPDDTLGIHIFNRADYYIANGNECIAGLIPDTLSSIPYYRTLCNSKYISGANLDWIVSYLLRTCYLGTIQNQSNPALKTPADTMSITYTLSRSYE